MTESRLQTLYDILARANLDAVALIPGPNLQYITHTDFHLMERPLVVFFMPEREPVAVAPALEVDRLAESGIPFKVFPWTDSEGYAGAFAAAAGDLKLGGKRLGVEELRMRVLESDIIQELMSGIRLVHGGDALADTPEPLAPFFDLFIPGDGEKPLTELIELVRRAKANGQSRQQTLLEAARTIESVYVPALYRPRTVDGVYLGLEPVRDDVPREILRAAVANLDESPVIEAPLVPLAEAVHDRVVIEVMRGCPNGCYFCQAGAARLPVRTRKIDQIVDAAKAAVEATGHNEISLLSLSTSDYPYLEELIARLSEEFTPRHVSISLPSLRVDSQLRLLPRLTSGVRKGGLTIAAEAGSERLRQAIGKRITEQDMIEGVKAAYKAGWRSVKVYFMAGLPGETPEDIDEIYHLCRRLSDARREVDGQRGAISASVSWLVPKPHTPMQWFAMRDGEYFLNVRRRLRDISHRSPVSFKFHRVERSGLEGLLCRGGREVAAVIENAWRDGARLDTWDEFFDWPRWQRACANAGVDFEAIVNRPLATSSAQPWSHIRCRQSHEYLLSRYHKTSEIVAQQDGPAQDPIQPSPRS